MEEKIKQLIQELKVENRWRSDRLQRTDGSVMRTSLMVTYNLTLDFIKRLEALQKEDTTIV